MIAPIAIVAAAVLREMILERLLGPGFTYILFFPAVMVVATFAGLGPGLLATALAAVASVVWGFPAGPIGAPNAISLAVFVLMGVFMSVVAEQYRRVRRRATVYEQERATQTRYQALVLASEIVWSTDATGAAVADSPSWRAFTGQTYEQWKGFGWLDVFHPDDRERVNELWRRAIADRTSLETEYRIRHTSGDWRWTLARAVPVLNSDGSIREWVGMNSDITERKRAEEALLQQREWFRVTLSSIGDAVITTDIHGKVSFLNPVAERMTGWKSGESVGLPLEKVFNLLHEGTRLPVENPLAEALRDGIVVGLANHTALIARDGTETAIEDSAAPIRDASGAITGAVMVFHDVTERRRADDAMRRRGAQFEALLNQAPLGVYLVDGDFRLRAVNPIAAPVFGNRPDFIGRDFDEVIRLIWPKPVADEVVRRFRHTLETGEAYIVPELIEKRADRDATEYNEWQINRIPLPEGGHGVVCYFRDISARVLAQQKIRESEERYRSLFDAAPMAVFVCDRHAVIQAYNRQAAALWGREPACGVEQHCGAVKLWLPDGTLLPHHQSPVVEVLRTGAPARNVEVVIERPDGSRLPVLVNFAALKNAAGEITGAITSFVDVSAWKRPEANLAFLAAVSQSLTRLTSVDEIMETVGAKIGAYLNLSLCAFAEIDEAADLGIVTHDWHRDDVRGVVGVYKLEEFLTDDFQKAGRAGEIFVVRDTTTDPRTDAAGYATLQIGAFVCVPLIQEGRWRFLLCIYHSQAYDWREDEIELVRELTTRIWSRLEGVRAEVALRESKAKLEFTLESAQVGDWDLDLANDTARCSLQHDQAFGYNEPVKDWGFEKFIRHVHPADRAGIEAEFRAAIAQHKDMRFECRVIWPDGSVHWIAAHGSIYRIVGGKPVRMLGIITNITERKRLESAETAEKKVLAQIALGAPTPEILDTLVREMEGQSAEAMLGSVLLSDETGRKLLHGAAPSLPASYNQAIHGIEIGPNVGSCGTAAFERQPVFVTDIATDARWVNFKELAAIHGLAACSSAPIFSSQGRILGAVAMYYRRPHNPSAQERKLIERATQLAAIVIERKQAEEALRESEERFRDIAGNIPQLAWIADGEGYVGWFNRAWLEYTGTTLEDNQGPGWKAVHHPEHIDRVAEKFERHLREGLDWEDTFPLRGKDGQYRWFLSRMNAIRDESGKVVRFFGTNTDVTELRETQAKLAEANAVISSRAEQLEELVNERTARLSETIEELESFSYSISHDMRAPLRAMQSFAQILEEECGQHIGAQGKEYIRRIVTSADRMDQLIRDVLTYSKIARTELTLESVDLAALLNGILEGYPQFQAPKAEINVVFPLPRVHANAAALTQCLSNLIGNAVKFVAPGVVPKVRVWADVKGERVYLYVQDNGIGIDPKMHGKIFDIFYRLGKDYEGTGIGLAVVRRAAQRMGGEVGLKSEPGKGTTFHLELDRAAWK